MEQQNKNVQIIEQENQIKRENTENCILGAMAMNCCFAYAYSKCLEENDFTVANNREIFSSLKKKTENLENLHNIEVSANILRKEIKYLIEKGSDRIKYDENIMNDNHSIVQYIMQRATVFFALIIRIKSNSNISIVHDKAHNCTIIFKIAIIKFLDKYFDRSIYKEGLACFANEINNMSYLHLMINQMI